MTLLVDPEFSEEKREKLIAKIQKVVEELKGKVAKTDEWGRKKLAYPIKKKELGYYFLWEVKFPEEKLGNLEKKLKLEEGLSRYLLVKKE